MMPALDAQNDHSSLDDREFKLFRTLIHAHTGIWLRDGKQIMLASRLGRRLRHHGLSSFSEYYELVQAEGRGGDEIGELINCVTTNKTAFFREPHHFDFLAERLPELLSAGGSRAKRISVWSGACSTGEEPYSIAMTLLEAMQTPPLASFRGCEIHVTASDIDTRVLEAAARGVYDEEAADSIPTALQKKYFLRGKDNMAGSIKVKRNVAGLVQFQRINLMDAVWPLQGPFDAIFFRNALIYFQQETQDLFLRKMARQLQPGGYLFLGHSENITWLHDLLEPLNRTIYRLREPS